MVWIKNNWKAILAGIAVLVFFGIAKKLFAIVSKFLTGSGTGLNTDPEVTASKRKIIDAVPVNSSQLGTLVKYQDAADQFENAMKDIGTDFNTMLSLSQRLNADELKQVYKFFGLREYYSFGFSAGMLSLVDWMKLELSDWSFYGKTEMDLMREAWAKTGLFI